MDSLDDYNFFTGYEPKSYDLKDTHVESYTESLTHPQFSEQRFLEDLEYDDNALEEMLREAHRVHVYHSQREGMSVGQSSSESDRMGRSVGERTGRLVRPSGQELNVGNAQIRTLLDRQKEQILAECQAQSKKHEFQVDYDRRSVRKLGETIDSQQEEFHRAQAEELHRRDQQLLHERLLKQKWELREDHHKSLNEMEKLITLLQDDDKSKIEILSLNSLARYRNCRMKLIVWMIQKMFKMLNRHAVDIHTLPVNLCHSHLIQFLEEC